MPRIDEQQIDRIKQAIDIVDVIGRYVELRRRGKDYLALCPFHVEKTPSFKVSEQKQLYHCFGCGRGGDVLEFLKEHEGIGFVEALEHLAEMSGQELKLDKPGEESQELIMLRVNETVMRLYAESGHEVAVRFLKHRGLPEDLAGIFHVGYARSTDPELVRLNPSMENVMLKTGLIMKHSGLSGARGVYKGFQERFAARIIFPIIHRKYPVGFGARAVVSGHRPKYLNSSESLVYQKSRVLFGMSEAKAEARKTGHVYVVEGYTDVLAMRAAGVRNVVATCGTAFTDGHVRLLVSMAQVVHLVFDSDLAGRRAAYKSVRTALNRGVVAYLATLPGGQDPADVYQLEGPEALVRYLGSSLSFLDYYARLLKDKPVDKKIVFVRDMEEAAGRIADKTVRGVILKEIAEKFGGAGIVKTLRGTTRSLENQALSVLLDSQWHERAFDMIEESSFVEKQDLFVYLLEVWKSSGQVPDVLKLVEKFRRYEQFIKDAVTSVGLMSDKEVATLLRKLKIRALRAQATELNGQISKASGNQARELQVEWLATVKKVRILEAMTSEPPL